LGLIEGVRYLVDGAAPAQVARLMALLGAPCTPTNIVALDPTEDYRVKDLHVASLGAAKPATRRRAFERSASMRLGAFQIRAR